ncbi:hypothetical protein UA08_08155 [Talaromyces atroroseus]|uniref:C2H2-type domain-containing protein n=1 Tax=Talaromyces atroroseus TaxID=1441469 RepID=A0A225ANS7_TALAT|nr:hypothetical protein UA08_08155 [Talaromyces atroroseus]OKL56606.1 hypothetical protein UA08_08155 [Talaromyces atroroseus]
MPLTALSGHHAMQRPHLLNPCTPDCMNDRKSLPEGILRSLSMLTNSRAITEPQYPLPSDIGNRYKYADITLARKLGKLNLYNRLRLKDSANGSEPGNPIETHARVSGFNSVVTFEESGGQVHVPIPLHHADYWSPSNSSRITRQIESSAPWQVHLEAPFKCSLCKKIVTLRGQEAWMIHVYADLKAYVCIHPSCKQSFEYFHLWADHVLTYHFPELKRYCVYCNGEILSTPGISTRNAFVEHLVYNHWNTLSDTERTAAVLNTERFVFAPFDSDCGICRRSNWKTWYDFAAHVARHLEEISLAALSDIPYPLNNISEMKTEKIRSRHSKKNLQSKPKEKDEPTKSMRAEKQVISLEERAESDESDQEDPDYVKIGLEPPDTLSPSIKKPHRDSLRLRKVRDNSITKAKESIGEQSESLEVPGHGKLTITGSSEAHVKFKSKDRRHIYQRSGKSPSKSNTINLRQQLSPQYSNEDVQQTHAIDLPNSHYYPYHFQHGQQNLGVQGYENYRYAGAVVPQNYYMNNYYPYVQGVYDQKSGYHSPMNGEHAFSGQIHQCECPTCAMSEDYA